VEFIRNADGSWFLSKRAGHSVRRTLMAQGHGKGVHANVIQPMRQAMLDAGIELHENTMITRLLLAGDTVAGAYAVGPDGVHYDPRQGGGAGIGRVNRLYSILCEEVVDPKARTTGDPTVWPSTPECR
jgi:fumarate reductase (CoM/CoB) subunit A